MSYGQESRILKELEEELSREMGSDILELEEAIL